MSEQSPAPATTEAPAAPAVDSGATPTPPVTEPPAPQGDATQAPTTDDLWSDPVKAKAEIERLRKENGNARTNAKAAAADEARQELAQTIGKALGLIKDDGDTPPDPAQLASAAQVAADEAREAKVELAVYRAAGAIGADPDELLERRTIVAALHKLDPAAEDFSAQVKAVIKQAVTDNPRLLVQAQVAGASSTDHPGGSGEVADIDAQIAAAEKAGDHTRAIALKRQRARMNLS